MHREEPRQRVGIVAAISTAVCLIKGIASSSSGSSSGGVVVVVVVVIVALEEVEDLPAVVCQINGARPIDEPESEV